MKTLMSLAVAIMLTGCSLNPYRMANYFPDDQPATASYSAGSAYASGIRGSTIVTGSGTYVIVPNYSSGGAAAIIRSGR